ncbi:DNA polymerase I [Klebsiella aerogenes]|nr:DNA polymerase I [Klebsiella aerogenes]
MMRIAPTAGATSACQSTKPAARRCRRRWWPRCQRCGRPSNSGGIRCWASPGSEADDLAATLAVKVAQAGHQATIVSTDKGYCQLLSPTIRIRDYFQKRWLDAPFIASEFGVTPEQLADYWGLAGISSSKVPGVAGIGPKSAAQLLNEFQDLEGLYAVWPRSRRSGAKNWPRIRRWPSPAGKWPACRPTSSWTAICSSCG